MNYKILLMLFLTLFFITGAYALPFSNFSTVTGSIGNGNGYYSAESAFTNTTASRNIYVVAEPTQIVIVEPIGYPQGQSGAITLMLKGDSNFQYASVLSDGYLYFTDSQGLKKRKTRDSNTVNIANTSSEVLTILASASIGQFYEYQGRIYFIDGTTLKYTSAPDYQVTTVWTGITKGQSLAVTNVNGVFTLFVGIIYLNSGAAPCGGSTNKCATLSLLKSTTSTKNEVSYTYNGGARDTSATLVYSYSTLFLTPTYIYLKGFGSVFGTGAYGNISTERTYYLSNLSLATTDTYTSTISSVSNSVYLGGYSTIAMHGYSSAVYDTFNFAEAGIPIESTNPAQITYVTKTITSLDPIYYNKSDIYLEYNVVINSLATANIGFLSDFGDYRWSISLTDPNGVSQTIIQSPACSYDGILDPTCQVTSAMGIRAPSNGWLAGSWTAKLYEVNIVTPNRALIATSTAFTVLNTSQANQSIIPPPFIPPTAGTSPQTISIIDGVVGYFNIGVNATSKLLFAMVIIFIFFIVGLVYGKNGDVAMASAFLPYAFFTYIDYIPKWIFIIMIIILGIYSRVFR